MCMIINVQLSLTFLIALAFLVVVIGTIMVVTLRIFSQVFPPVRRPERQCPGKHLRHSGGKGLCPGGP